MLSFLSGFFIFNLLYHIFTTITVYGREFFSSSFPSLLRESIRCLFIFIIFLLNYKQRKSYRNRRKRSRITFGIVLIFATSISYFFKERWFQDIFIGIKYWFRRMFILLSATSIGYFYRNIFSNKKFLSNIKRGLILTIIIWLLRQGAKLITPTFFERIGYGPLDDFHFWSNPPLYYLTGYEGTLRRQGIFAGPNNYGYFLVAFFPLILLFFGEKIKNLKQISLFQWINIGIICLWIIAMIMTLSRAVILWGILVLIILNRKTIKTNKKRLLWWWISLAIIITILSILKRESTLWHLTSKLWAIPHIINEPLGYGLGSSGPAVHHNGTLLPENYFFQIMLDTGTTGFILRTIAMFQLIGIHYYIKKSLQQKKTTETEQTQYLMLNRIQIGFLSLLLIGLFLHVFEDSMVNYLFFIIYGIFLGTLSHLIQENIRFFFPNKTTLLKK